MQKSLRLFVLGTATVVVGLVMKSDRRARPTAATESRAPQESAAQPEPAANLAFRPEEDLFDVNELPESLSYGEIARSLWNHGGRISVLAWKIMEDDRPLRVESCLAFEALEDDEGYYLMHLYRHPDDGKSAWQLSTLHASFPKDSKYFPGMWFTHITRFDHRPGNIELYAALTFEGVNWSFELPERWKIIGCRVCERTWQEAIGEKPTQFFSR